MRSHSRWRTAFGVTCACLCLHTAPVRGEDTREISLLPPGVEHNVPTPSVVAVDDEGGLAYVAGHAAAAIASIDLATGEIHTIPAAADVRWMTVQRRSGALLVQYVDGATEISPRGGSALRPLEPRGITERRLVADPTGDGFLAVVGARLQRLLPDGRNERIRMDALETPLSLAVAPEGRLAHVLQYRRGDPRATAVTVDLEDGRIVARREFECGELAPRRISVHPPTGRVAVVLGQGDRAWQVGVAPAEGDAFVFHDVGVLVESHVCAVDPLTGMFAITDDNGSKAYLIDISHDKPRIEALPLGGKGNGIDIRDDLGLALFQNWSGQVTLADTRRGRIVRRLDAPSHGHMYFGARLAPSAGLAVVAESYYGPNRVTLAPLDGSEPRQLVTGRELGQGVFDGNRVVVTTAGTEVLTVDLRSGKVEEIPVPEVRVRAIASGGRRRGLLVAGGYWLGVSHLAWLDVRRKKARLGDKVGPLPRAAVATRDTVWIASASPGNDLYGSISAVDLGSGAVHVSHFGGDQGGCYWPMDPLRATEDHAWAIHAATGAIYGLAEGEEPRRIDLPGRPQAFDIDERGEHAWVALVGQPRTERKGPGSLAVVDLEAGTVTARPLGTRAAAVAVGAEGGVVYVADHGGRAIHRLGPHEHTFELDDGFAPLALAVDRKTDDAYVGTCSPERLRVLRIRSEGEAPEVVYEAEGPYGRGVLDRPWIEFREYRRPVMRILIGGRPRRGVLLDCRGGRLVTLPLR